MSRSLTTGVFGRQKDHLNGASFAHYVMVCSLQVVMSEVESFIDDAEHSGLLNLLKQCSIVDPKGNDGSVIRFRAPYLNTCVHDARGDAISLIVEQLTLK